MTQPIPAARPPYPHLRRKIIALVRPYRWLFACVLVIIAIAAALDTVPYLLVKAMLDDAIKRHSWDRLILYCSGIFLVPIIGRTFATVQGRILTWVGQSVVRDLRTRLYVHLQRMSFSFFTNTKAGEIQTRFTTDISGLQGFVTRTCVDFVSNVFAVTCTLCIMFYISPLLTLVALMILPGFVVNHRWTAKRNRPLSMERQRLLTAYSSYIHETLSVPGALLTKHFGRQQFVTENFQRQNNAILAIELRQQRTGSLASFFTTMLMSGITASIFLVAGWQFLSGETVLGAQMSIGNLVAFAGVLGRFSGPATQLFSIQANTQNVMPLFERVFGYLDMPIRVTDASDAIAMPAAQVQGKVEFRGVSFAYRNEKGGVPVGTVVASPAKSEKGGAVTDISFAIPPGKLVALVGPSGAGKTTIGYLLSRLYDVDEGMIAIDGVDIRRITLNSLAGVVGVVAQEPFLLHASVRENIAFARPDATDEEIVAAARAAAIHERIEELGDGYDTIVGERGYRFSGGEKQRIAIARLILKDPKVILLDEATSSLDTGSERLVQASLQRLVRGRTSLVIAHRLSTVLMADEILVLEQGQIIERGTHAELLQRGEAYARLYQQQFASVGDAGAEAAYAVPAA